MNENEFILYSRIVKNAHPDLTLKIAALNGLVDPADYEQVKVALPSVSAIGNAVRGAGKAVKSVIGGGKSLPAIAPTTAAAPIKAPGMAVIARAPKPQAMPGAVLGGPKLQPIGNVERALGAGKPPLPPKGSVVGDLTPGGTIVQKAPAVKPTAAPASAARPAAPAPAPMARDTVVQSSPAFRTAPAAPAARPAPAAQAPVRGGQRAQNPLDTPLDPAEFANLPKPTRVAPAPTAPARGATRAAAPAPAAPAPAQQTLLQNSQYGRIPQTISGRGGNTAVMTAPPTGPSGTRVMTAPPTGPGGTRVVPGSSVAPRTAAPAPTVAAPAPAAAPVAGPPGAQLSRTPNSWATYQQRGGAAGTPAPAAPATAPAAPAPSPAAPATAPAAPSGSIQPIAAESSQAGDLLGAYADTARGFIRENPLLAAGGAYMVGNAMGSTKGAALQVPQYLKDLGAVLYTEYPGIAKSHGFINDMRSNGVSLANSAGLGLNALKTYGTTRALHRIAFGEKEEPQEKTAGMYLAPSQLDMSSNMAFIQDLENRETHGTKGYLSATQMLNNTKMASKPNIPSKLVNKQQQREVTVSQHVRRGNPIPAVEKTAAVSFAPNVRDALIGATVGAAGMGVNLAFNKPSPTLAPLDPDSAHSPFDDYRAFHQNMGGQVNRLLHAHPKTGILAGAVLGATAAPEARALATALSNLKLKIAP